MNYQRIWAVVFAVIGLTTIATSYIGFVVDITNTQLFGMCIVVFSLTQLPKEDIN